MASDVLPFNPSPAKLDPIAPSHSLQGTGKEANFAVICLYLALEAYISASIRCQTSQSTVAGVNQRMRVSFTWTLLLHRYAVQVIID